MPPGEASVVSLRFPPRCHGAAAGGAAAPAAPRRGRRVNQSRPGTGRRRGEYCWVMPAADFEEHREQARRAQRLSDQAREQVGSERAAAERCEYLMADATDPGLRELHRQAADLHRQALHQYEEAARLQQLHADHERRAAERTVAMQTAAAGNPGATADRRDIIADERDHFADIRELAADEREHRADNREQRQYERAR